MRSCSGLAIVATAPYSKLVLNLVSCRDRKAMFYDQGKDK
jgi:hypothetical protein